MVGMTSWARGAAVGGRVGGGGGPCLGHAAEGGYIGIMEKWKIL